MSDASLCNVSAGGAKLFRSGAKLTNEVSGALILAMPMGDRRRRICELRKAQRPTKLLVPGFASGTHSYDELHGVFEHRSVYTSSNTCKFDVSSFAPYS